MKLDLFEPMVSWPPNTNKFLQKLASQPSITYRVEYWYNRMKCKKTSLFWGILNIENKMDHIVDLHFCSRTSLKGILLTQNHLFSFNSKLPQAV